MNGKKQDVEYLPNELLHENTTLTPFDNEVTNSVLTPSNKRTYISSSGERKASKHCNSHTNEIAEDSNKTAGKVNGRETSHYADINNIGGYGSDVSTSTYALQIALKSMKERYQRLQRKISDLEEENGKLFSGKSELFGEIGKMQENSIKLREKNLQLNHEVHSKHQECCSLKEQVSSVSKENLRLNTELLQASNQSKKLSKEVEDLQKENSTLKESLEEIWSHCKNYSLPSELLLKIEFIISKNLKKSSSISDLWPKTKIIPRTEDLEQLDDFKTITINDTIESFDWDLSKDSDSLSLDACMKTRDLLRKVKDSLLLQNNQLHELNHSSKISKRKLDSDESGESGDQGKHYSSRLATCGSGRHPSGVNLSSMDIALCGTALEDSGGETNVLVEEFIEESDKKTPFDWRKVDVSDDEAPEERPHRPETRTVSTSPDLTLPFDMDEQGRTRDLSSEEDRTCPMCNAVFPLILPQERFESHVVSHFEVENGYEVVS
ncbi:hypothetical protein Anas_12181 [Armadillidium nasatum]|uniref:UBZ1-type domain-containing protein n=1 Tax=Armadillidium nasatum TaxID=96803 RepID=A0A5N5SUG5_9CRUS|nr:hypothetical protein Anas_12181 [Armadillidium nasatum]